MILSFLIAKINFDRYNVYMRVLIIFNHPAPYKVNTFNELAKFVDLTVLFERTKAKDRPDSFYASNEYKFNYLFLKDGYFGKEGSLSNNVRKYIKKHQQEYDVILMNGYSHLAELKAIKYMSKHHIKFGLLINGGVVKKESCFKRKYKTRYISKASFYLSPSKASNEYLKYYGATNPIYNYPYCNIFSSEIVIPSLEERTRIRNKFHLPLDKNIFINASQFIDRKNNIELMSIFKAREDHLVLVGEGPLKEKYQKFIIDNNLNNVHLVSFLNKKDLFELYRACDVHVSLSKQDIFGHTILEALSCSLPVVASKNIVSALEYISNDKNGYVVDINNIEEINSSMSKALKLDKEKIRESISNNTFEKSAEAIYKILKEIYE